NRQAAVPRREGVPRESLQTSGPTRLLPTREASRAYATTPTSHDRCDGRLGMPEVKAERAHALLKKMRIVPQLRHRVLGLLEQLHCGNAGGHIRSGRGAGKHVGTGTLLEILDEYLTPRDVAANDPKRFGEHAHLDIDRAEQAKVMANAPTTQVQ